MDYQFIIVTENVRPHVGTVQLHRPKVLNALSPWVMEELVHAFAAFDADPDARCIVIHGNERAFAAGADIKQMATSSGRDSQQRDQFSMWEAIKETKTPVIAAVSGFALGSGCELAMLCDMIVASETAQFGQPEIKIGVMPGAGGTQRLTRAVGKALAMEMVLTGRFVSAREALAAGLVNKVVPPELFLAEALNLASLVASMPPLAAQKAKEAVLMAFDTGLSEGLAFERENFQMLFETEDQKEGMAAFVEKRKPKWKGK